MDTPKPLTFAPELVTPDHVRGLSLHDITAQFGTNGLMVRLQDELARYDLADEPGVKWALGFGLTLHANDTRTNGHYKDHILRVALRPIVHYGVQDPVVAAGCLLHDSVEDHPHDIVRILTGESESDEALARERALGLIAVHTSDEVATMVEALTNPLLEEGEDKAAAHFIHTRDVILPSPKARVGKLSDFTDNAVGNHYTMGSKQQKLDAKYLDEYQLHAQGLFLPDSLITGPERDAVLRQLHTGHHRALARISMAST